MHFVQQHRVRDQEGGLGREDPEHLQRARGEEIHDVAIAEVEEAHPKGWGPASWGLEVDFHKLPSNFPEVASSFY